MGFTEALTFRFTGSYHRKYLKSPVPSLLRCNDAPSDEEVVHIHRVLRETEARVTALEAKNGYVHDRYINFFRSHLKLLSVLRRLPTEILVEIFLHVLEVPTDPTHNSPPWRLGHICRRWRNIALGTPMLWTALPPLYLSNVNSTQSRWKSNCLAALLVRSSTQKLSFHLSKQQGPPCADDPTLSLLFEHSNRWEQISLDITDRSWAYFSSVKCRLASLRSLTLNLTSLAGRIQGDVDVFKIAPALREVCISASTFNEVIGLPRSQLTSFAEEIVDSIHFNLALSTSPSIKKLSFILDPSIEGSIDIPPTTQASLKTLIIRSFSQQTAPNPDLRKLILPALEELIFRYSFPNTYAQDLWWMVVLSHCKLRKLVLSSPQICPKSVLEILIANPSLTDLDINTSSHALLLFFNATKTSHGQWLIVPSLQSFTLRLNRIDHGPTFTTLMSLAKRRCDLSQADFPDDVAAQRLCRLKTFKISPRPVKFVSYAYEEFARHFGLQVEEQPATDHVTNDATIAARVTSRQVADHLYQIELSHNDTSIIRKGRTELVVQRVEGLVSFLEEASMTITPENVVDLYVCIHLFPSKSPY